ncbi:MAG: DUF2169 domain-containing protein [Neisseriaceae bacterium]|nr:DUF2169 domain-containing protein [Neisseriaceae bacterium]
MALFELDNLTGFPAQNIFSLDALDAAYHTVVAKISYDMTIDPQSGHCALTFAAKQQPLAFADEHYGDPQHTSVRQGCDTVPYKPYLDVIINATAYAPQDKPCKQFGVVMQIGERKKALAVRGPTFWQKEPLGWSLTDPTPITSLPLKYEYAHGGTQQWADDHHIYPANPIGVGWYAKPYLSRFNQKNLLPAAQIFALERPINDLSQDIGTEGFGVYGRSWLERYPLAGTADAVWQEERHPLMPQDFSMHYWNDAHPDLQFTHPKPNHVYTIRLTNMVAAKAVPSQIIELQLPVETVFVYLKTEDNIGLCQDLTLDTIHIDVDSRRLSCTYRVTLAHELNIDECQLRHIARAERGAQIAAAKALGQEPAATAFIPIPPSLSLLNECKDC